MRPVAPRLILYLAQRGETVFSPVLLLEVTVAELIASVAELLQVDLLSQILKLLPTLHISGARWSFQQSDHCGPEEDPHQVDGRLSAIPAARLRFPLHPRARRGHLHHTARTRARLRPVLGPVRSDLKVIVAFFCKRVIFQVPSASPRCQLIFISEQDETWAIIVSKQALNKLQTSRRGLNICRPVHLLSAAAFLSSISAFCI